MNTRKFNIQANKRLKAKGGYHDRVSNDDGFDVVRSREEGIGGSGRGRLKATTRTEQRVDGPGASWDTVQSWMPEDNTQYGLSNEDAWFDDETEGNIVEPSPTVGRKKKTIVSVRVIRITPGAMIKSLSIEATPCYLEGVLSRFVFG